jgi:hypothetical protein
MFGLYAVVIYPAYMTTAYECYARVEAPDWRFSDKRVINFRPNITPKRLGY